MKKLCPIHYRSIKKNCDTIRGYSISFGTKIVEKAELVDKPITIEVEKGRIIIRELEPSITFSTK